VTLEGISGISRAVLEIPSSQSPHIANTSYLHSNPEPYLTLRVVIMRELKRYTVRSVKSGRAVGGIQGWSRLRGEGLMGRAVVHFAAIPDVRKPARLCIPKVHAKK